MDTKTVTLNYPVILPSGERFEQVTFRRPKGKDMALIARLEALKAEGGGELTTAQASDVSLVMIRAFTGLPEQVVEELDLLADIPMLAEEAASFFEQITPEARPSGEA